MCYLDSLTVAVAADDMAVLLYYFPRQPCTLQCNNNMQFVIRGRGRKEKERMKMTKISIYLLTILFIISVFIPIDYYHCSNLGEILLLLLIIKIF